MNKLQHVGRTPPLLCSSCKRLMTPAAFFRFMDLPKKIRLMIYDRLPRRITHHRISVVEEDESNEAITLILRSTSTSILSTSKTIYDEAYPIVQRTLQRFILEKAPQLAGTRHEAAFIVLEVIMDYAVRIARYVQRTQVKFSCFRRTLEVRTRNDMINALRSALSWRSSSVYSPDIFTCLANFDDQIDIVFKYLIQAARQLLHIRSMTQNHQHEEHHLPPRFEYVGLYSCHACHNYEHSIFVPGGHGNQMGVSLFGTQFAREISNSSRDVPLYIASHFFDTTGKGITQDAAPEHWSVRKTFWQWCADRLDNDTKTMVLPPMKREKWKDDWRSSS